MYHTGSSLGKNLKEVKLAKTKVFGTGKGSIEFDGVKTRAQIIGGIPELTSTLGKMTTLYLVTGVKEG